MTDPSTARAEQLFAERRRRREFFPSFLDDQAWAMILWLFVEQERGRRATAEDAYAAVEISEAAGSRWLSLLRQHRLLAPADARTGVALSEPGRDTMRRYLAAA